MPLPGGGAGPRLADLHLLEAVLHGWDLATATGQDRADPDAVEAVLRTWYGNHPGRDPDAAACYSSGLTWGIRSATMIRASTVCRTGRGACGESGDIVSRRQPYPTKGRTPHARHPLLSSMGRDQGSAADDPIRLYYSNKTQEILHKYGPGPRVHFHVGLYPDGPPDSTAPQYVLQQRMLDAQERIVEHAARSWGAYEAPPRRLLDIGCGLGGTSLYWAQEHGASVTSLTVAAEHIPIVRHFARHAGVGGG